MAARSAKAMFSRMMLTYEAFGVVVAKNGQGVIMVDDFTQFNGKSVEGICRVLKRPGGNTAGVSNPGI